MAKTIMKCPFSERICEECAIYRGRHYFLCFDMKYRGYIDDSAKRTSSAPFNAEAQPLFEIPIVIPDKAIDPFKKYEPDNKG